MISSIVQNSFNRLSKKTNKKLEADLKEKGKDLLYHLTVVANENFLSEVKPLQMFEAYFAGILCEMENLTFTTVEKYLSICNYFEMNPTYSTYVALINIRSNDVLKRAAKALAMASSTMLYMTNYKNLKQEISDFLTAFVLLINDKSNNILEFISELVENCKCKIVQNIETPKSNLKATSLNGSFVELEADLPIKLVEFGATLTQKRNTTYISFGCIVENPNSTKRAKNIKIELKLLNEEGFIVETHSFSIFSIMPNSKMGLGAEISCESTEIYNYKVVVHCDNFVEFVKGVDVENNYEINFVEEKINQYYNERTIKYNLKNNSQHALNNGRAYLIFRDSSNKIVGGLTTYFNESSKDNICLLSFYGNVQVSHNQKEVYIDFYN